MPNWNHIVRAHLAVLRLPPEREIEIVEELALHMEAAYEDALADGLSAAEAEARAVQGYDWRLLECELSRAEQPVAARALQPPLELIDRKGGMRMESLLQDLRFGARMLVKNPGFTLIAVLTLALGIGANTAMFSVVNAVLLRPLPYPAAEQLVQLYHHYPKQNLRASVSPVGFAHYRQVSQSFAETGAMTGWEANLTGQGEPERLRGARVTASFFHMLGVNVARGRGFTRDDDQPGRNRVVIVSDGLWRRRFGGAAELVNQTITINGENYVVIGVAPPGFEFGREFGETVEVWTPLAFAPEQLDARQWRQEFLGVFARLKPNVTLPQAQAEMEKIAAGVRQQQWPGGEAAGWSLLMRPLAEVVVGDVRRQLWMLLAAVGFVLLIACANVANLLLARAVARQKEIALRAALGATRRRVGAQLLAESLLLASLGGACGWLLAYGGVKLLTGLTQINLPRWHEVGLDWRVFGFTALVSLATGTLFGLVPAWQAARVDVNELLKAGGRNEATWRGPWRSGLVIVELALALVLLIGAGLLVRSLQRVQQVNPGFRPAGLLVMQIALPRNRYRTPAQTDAFYQQLLGQMRALPGVQSVGATSILPLSGVSAPPSNFEIEGRAPAPGQVPPHGDRWAVTADYFQTMQIPLLRGRAFTESDQAESQPVAIIDESMARQHWPDENPIGKRLSFQRDPQGNPVWREIVGLVGHVKPGSLEREARGQCYVPHRQLSAGGMFLVVRTAHEPASLAASVRNVIRQADAELPVFRVTTMEQLVAASLAQRRFTLAAFGLFAGVALLLAAVGLYGVLAYVVAQRTHEIGVRLALGAQSGDVLRLIVGQGMELALAGLLIGLGGALALTRLLQPLLFGVRATDPMTFGGIALLLLLVAFLACWIPARRATKVDPLTALRHE